jgi:hypothetical protein
VNNASRCVTSHACGVSSHSHSCGAFFNVAFMTAHTSSVPSDNNDDDGQAFEEGSSAGSSNEGYVTPDEYVVDEDGASSDAVMQVCIIPVLSCYRSPCLY